MRNNILHGYLDSFFTRQAMRAADELFGGNMDYLPITMKMSLHDVIMVALRNADLLSGIVFHGGTCLQRIYSWTRLSEDLDFANISEMGENRFTEFGSKFGAAIRGELKRLGFADEQITVRDPKNLEWPGAAEPAVRRWSMRVNVGPRNMKHMVNVELVDMPSYRHAPKAFIPLSSAVASGPVMVNVEPLDVIFNDKAVSILQRQFIKNRDIYDVGLLSSSHAIDKDLFLKKLADRKFTHEYVMKRITEARELLQAPDALERFTAEMSRFVIPGKTRDVANPKVATEIVAKSLGVLGEMERILGEAANI